jgi:hypothetical protein
LIACSLPKFRGVFSTQRMLLLMLFYSIFEVEQWFCI